jgi:hypothetical protein
MIAMSVVVFFAMPMIVMAAVSVIIMFLVPPVRTPATAAKS